MDDIFEHAEKIGKTPVIVLPLPDGRMIDVWTFLAALYEVLDDDDSQTGFEMVLWLGNVIYEAMESIPKPEKIDKKNIAQIYRKETENFDERFEQFLKSLEDGNEQTDKP
jgi:hypothetical protein